MFLVFLLALNVSLLAAQDDNNLPVPQRAEVDAGDGLTLVGDFYPVPDGVAERPGVLLLHGGAGNRHTWEPLIGPLLDNGFNVLTVDQRAHGETGGVRDMIATIADVQVWLDWMRQQPTVEDNSLATIGASWGTPPALAGCATDEGCVTTIAISPGDYPLLNEAMFETMRDRSVLFIVGRDDVFFATRTLFDRTSGEVALYAYNSAAHGTGFFASRAHRERVSNLIVLWLRDHTADG
jgi:pimeloyl-ACP methyl ester carboxylesterase